MSGVERSVPKIKTEREKGYAAFLAAGFDTLVETFNMVMPDELIHRLDVAKKQAEDQDKRGNALASVRIGGSSMQVSPRGGKNRAVWLLSCPDFTIDIRSPKTDWNITVRYSAAGIWQYGVDNLRQRVHALLCAECYPKAHDGAIWTQVSSAHIAFDFYSEKFSQEMTPDILARFVCHSSSKKHVNFSFAKPVKGSAWGRADYLETVTVGSKKTIELQIYDKGKEITEQSGKTWMFSVWEQNGYFPPDDKKAKHVWRLEVRFGKDYLDARQAKTFEDFSRSLDKLIAEALYTKRLTAISQDGNRRRRALHPLFVIALEQSGNARKMLPIGKAITKSGDALFEMYEKQSAGLARAMAMVKVGDADEADLITMAQRVWQTAIEDPEHLKKTEKLRERYKYVNTARG